MRGGTNPVNCLARLGQTPTEGRTRFAQRVAHMLRRFPDSMSNNPSVIPERATLARARNDIDMRHRPRFTPAEGRRSPLAFLFPVREVSWPRHPNKIRYFGSACPDCVPPACQTFDAPIPATAIAAGRYTKRWWLTRRGQLPSQYGVLPEVWQSRTRARPVGSGSTATSQSNE